MSKPNPKVDALIKARGQWQDEFKKLRKIILDCGLEEDVKWRFPCYMADGANVVIIQGFKAYCALLFFKGALLKNRDGVLVKTGENTQVGRQIRFTDVQRIDDIEDCIRRCIKEAVEVEKSGQKVEVKASKDLEIPEEFRLKLDKKPAVRKAFESLTPGRQRAYVFFIAGAKQSKTREARVEKCIPLILEGKGLND